MKTKIKLKTMLYGSDTGQKPWMAIQLNLSQGDNPLMRNRHFFKTKDKETLAKITKLIAEDKLITLEGNQLDKSLDDMENNIAPSSYDDNNVIKIEMEHNVSTKDKDGKKLTSSEAVSKGLENVHSTAWMGYRINITYEGEKIYNRIEFINDKDIKQQLGFLKMDIDPAEHKDILENIFFNKNLEHIVESQVFNEIAIVNNEKIGIKEMYEWIDSKFHKKEKEQEKEQDIPM